MGNTLYSTVQHHKKGGDIRKGQDCSQGGGPTHFQELFNDFQVKCVRKFKDKGNTNW